MDQNFLNSMQCLGKFGKFVCWRTRPPEGWRPLLQGLLDPSLLIVSLSKQKLIASGKRHYLQWVRESDRASVETETVKWSNILQFV